MTKKSFQQVRNEALARVSAIRQAMSKVEFACSGTLLQRRKVCGKPSCRCAQDPAERHGPYYEWTRRHKGALLHRVVTEEQAQMIRVSIANHRAILKHLRAWEHETIRVIESLGSNKR
jgi:hypothetical protein